PWVGDQECGWSEVTADNEFNYELHVLGQREREGCAAPGDVVRFLVGGVMATQTLTYTPFAQTSPWGSQVVHLVAIENYAWYWAEHVVDVPPPDGTVLQALVGDVVCGEVTMRAVSLGQGALQHMVGFSRLIVPSAESASGCGRPGAMVSFRMAGEEVATVAWEPGLQEIDLDLADAFAPSLPFTGSGGSASASPFWLVAFGTIGFLALSAGALGLRGRFP
ncbi:MAG: hypothetical protein IIB23_05290, partial [Chloroflexi bacterium]|nr:hypothetical protein [Chloroflexota bacterium]